MPVVVADIQSELLSGNPLGDPAARRVPVYVPPDYDTSEADYPVAYFLAGFGGGGTYLLSESLWGETLPARLDRLIAAGSVRPLIVVMPDCITRFGGSQYINSAATGRYEDHIVEELVPFIDGRFRTRSGRDWRCLMGKSSGGYGATVLAMRHPDLFGLAVDHSGDKYFDLCYRADIPRCVAALARYDHAIERFLDGFPQRPEERGRDWFTLVNMVAMSSCYSPNPQSPAGFDLPFDPYSGELREDVWQRWLEQDPVRLVARHAEALRSLRLYLLDCGRNDEHHLQLGGRIYARRLADLSVPHSYEEFEGGHTNVAHRYDLSLAAVSRVFGELG